MSEYPIAFIRNNSELYIVDTGLYDSYRSTQGNTSVTRVPPELREGLVDLLTKASCVGKSVTSHDLQHTLNLEHYLRSRMVKDLTIETITTFKSLINPLIPALKDGYIYMLLSSLLANQTLYGLTSEDVYSFNNSHKDFLRYINNKGDIDSLTSQMLQAYKNFDFNAKFNLDYQLNSPVPYTDLQGSFNNRDVFRQLLFNLDEVTALSKELPLLYVFSVLNYAVASHFKYSTFKYELNTYKHNQAYYIKKLMSGELG